MKRFFNIAIVLFLASGLFLTAQNAVASQPKIVASTSWVGAIVKAAGIDDVTVLATIDMRHPSEYDFKPSDIQLALEADYIVWAGYEPFIQRLIEVANIPEEKLIIVFTNNTPPLLRDTVLSVAQRFGTTEKASLWVEELEKLAQTLSDNATKLNVHEKRVVVQFHQKDFVEWLGYDIVTTFGPAELTPGKVAEVVSLDPEIIIDNWHSSQGEPLKEGREYVALINFPGAFNTSDLLDVLRHNGELLNIF